MGNVTTRSFCNNCFDSAMVDNNSSGSSYSLTLWGGGDSGSPAYNEDGPSFPRPELCNGGVPGCAADLVTQDSAVTGEITGITVIADNQAARVKCGTTTCVITGLSEAVKGSTVIARAGDSGGPWIVHEGSSTKVRVAGITEGSINGGTVAFFTQIEDLMSKYNVIVPLCGC